MTKQVIGVLHTWQEQTAGANPLHPSVVSNLPFDVLFIATGSQPKLNVIYFSALFIGK